jgi:transcriptional regulator with XRE-family HTH domain
LSELEKPAAKRIQRLAADRMRMLRLGAGWSAEKLSQEYGAGGAGELTRTTIAKIESDKRQIKAGEVDRIARVFGLTSADLLDPDGPQLFLSYAEQDEKRAQPVAAWLARHGFRVLSAGQPTASSERSSGDAADIDSAQAFVALLSPSFLSSPRCREELSVAARREQQLISAGAVAGFLYVLRIDTVAEVEDAALASHAVMDLDADNDRSAEIALSKVGAAILATKRASASRPGMLSRVAAGTSATDRGAELELVLNALANPSGAHFWLVISPPGFGKSSFLGQLRDKAADLPPAGWHWSTVTLRPAGDWSEGPAGVHDAAAVIRSLFELEGAPSPDPEADLRQAAQAIIRSGRPWLCLLDDAELLQATAVAQLRQYLDKISGHLQEARSPVATFALVVASRSDDGWLGVAPKPRWSVLRLPGLGPSAIQNALEGLPAPGASRSRVELRAVADVVLRASEGVPRLIDQSLDWIQAENWVDIGQLETPPVFDEIFKRYVHKWWLTQDTLLPRAGQGEPGELAQQLEALRQALRNLAPYRLITPYHVRHRLDTDSPFRNALDDAGWKLENLWPRMADMALLYRPLTEPWLEIHPAIRRLLFRYFAPYERADRHEEAREFTREWADLLTGREQVTGLVESIWHEAARLNLSHLSEHEEELVTYARSLSRKIRPSTYLNAVPSDDVSQRIELQDLRDYAAQRMENDEELQREVADVRGLFERLVDAVRDPAPEAGSQEPLR